MSTTSNRSCLDGIWARWVPGIAVEPASQNERRSGVSVRLRTPDGQVYTAHERVRKPDYRDVLLELSVNERDPESGWATVGRTDLVLLTWQESQRVLVLPGRALAKAVDANKAAWCARFGVKVRTMPYGYQSRLVGVPTTTLLAAVDAVFDSTVCVSCGATRSWSGVRAGAWPLGCAACRPEAPGVEWKATPAAVTKESTSTTG